MVIPKLHYISQGSSPEEHLENIQKACSYGAELVQLNLKSLPKDPASISEKKYLKIAEAARETTTHFQTRLIINGDYKIAKTLKADGVHLEPTDRCPTEARTHLYTWQSIGGTANTLQECETLLDKEIDYIHLGPFRETAKEANRPPVLGLDGYRVIMDVLKTPIPIIGVGGITTEDVTALLESGIAGVAVSTEITRDFNKIRLFNQLLNASSTAEQRHTFE